MQFIWEGTCCNAILSLGMIGDPSRYILVGNAYLSHMRAVESEYETKAEKEREKNKSQQLLRSTSASIASRGENKKPSRLRVNIDWRLSCIVASSGKSAKVGVVFAFLAPKLGLE